MNDAFLSQGVEAYVFCGRLACLSDYTYQKEPFLLHSNIMTAFDEFDHFAELLQCPLLCGDRPWNIAHHKYLIWQHLCSRNPGCASTRRRVQPDPMLLTACQSRSIKCNDSHLGAQHSHTHAYAHKHNSWSFPSCDQTRLS